MATRFLVGARVEIVAIALSICICICAAPLQSQAQGETAMNSGGWSVQITPYAWFAGLEGDVATRSGLPTASVDASFSDIIENTDIAIMLTADARFGRLGLATDLVYLAISANGNTRGPLFGQANAEVDALLATIMAYYRPMATEAATVDILAGTRIWYVETELEFSAGLLPGRKFGNDKLWADPVIGVRAVVELGSGFFLTGFADIGGFGVASDSTWQVLGTIDYRFRDWLSVRAGYRHLEVDYEDDGFLFDVAMSGPLVGVSFRF